MKHACIRRLIVVLCAFFCAHNAQILAAAQYEIHDLGLADRSSYPGQVNDSGTAVFWASAVKLGSVPIPVPDEAFVANLSGATILPSLGGAITRVQDINIAGTIVGQASGLAPGTLGPAAIRIVDGVIETLNIPSLSSASAINDSGKIVGRAGLIGSTHAFLWNSPSNVVDLGTLGGNVSAALDINNNGTVVGYSEFAPDHSKAFVYEENRQMTALDVFGSQNSSATAINEAGQIVGNFGTSDGSQRPFLVDPVTGQHDIGTPGLDAYAADINDLGAIVGASVRLANSSDYHAVIYNSTGGLQYLQDLIPPDSGWTWLFSANSINNRGQILGQGRINGESHVFLATPIPEPATSSAIGTLVLVVLAVGSRRRNR